MREEIRKIILKTISCREKYFEETVNEAVDEIIKLLNYGDDYRRPRFDSYGQFDGYYE